MFYMAKIDEVYNLKVVSNNLVSGGTVTIKIDRYRSND
jgi:hypothetical protein